MHEIGWKDNHFKSYEVFMIRYGCGAYIYTQFYDQINRIFKMIPGTYIQIFDEKTGISY